jgi:hypothetical protein
MPIPVEALKSLATHALYINLGPEMSKACALLLFGDANVAGVVDDEQLLDAALKQPDMSISPVRALASVSAAAKATFASDLLRKSNPAIAAGKLERDALDHAISLIIAADLEND